MASTQDDMIAELQRANAELCRERDTALAEKVALAEVLDVINRSPGDAGPVFDAILEKTHGLCAAAVGSLVTYDGEFFRAVATHGFPEQHAETVRLPVRASARHRALLRGERFVQTPDLRAIELSAEDTIMRRLIDHTDARTRLMVPLCKDGALLGFITAYRPEVRLFPESEIALLENFAAQAVIAMEVAGRRHVGTTASAEICSSGGSPENWRFLR